MDDATEAAAKSGYNGTYAWDLGTEGGTWRYSTIVDSRTISYIPMSKVNTSYNSIPLNILNGLPTKPDGTDIIASIIVGTIAGNIENKNFQKELNSGMPFMRFESYLNWVIDVSNNYFEGSDHSHLYVSSGKIGQFDYGIYGI